MNPTDSLIGKVDNGRRASLSSTLYTGDVGVRERGGGQIELAWFGRQSAFRLPVAGTLDGVAITITGMRVRDLSANQQGVATKAIVATAEVAA